MLARLVELHGSHLAVQYGAGRAVIDFWRDMFLWYTRLGKVTMRLA